MNCDQAFDQMTQLAGSHDPALRAHLASCPRCREMQDTLSPALGLFELDARSRPEEPWQHEAAAATELATQAAQRLAEAATPRRRPAATLLGFAASVMLGAGLVWGTLLIRPSSSPGAARWNRSDCIYLAEIRPTNISARQMMQNCQVCHQVARHE